MADEMKQTPSGASAWLYGGIQMNRSRVQRVDWSYVPSAQALVEGV